MKSFRTNIVLLILLFLVCTALYFFVFAKVKAINIEASQQIGNKLLYEERLREEKNFKKLLSETEVGRKNIAAAFVDHDDVAAFLSSLEALAEKWGVKLEVTTVAEAPATWDPTVTLLKLHVDISGSFERLLTFESVLQNMPVYAILSSATFAYNGKSAGGTLWRASVDMSIIERNHVSTP